MSNNHKSKAKRGGALLIVSSLAGAIGIGIVALQMYLPSLTEQTVKSSNIIQYKLALGSAIDYAAIAVRQRWCLNDNMLPDETCNYESENNTARLYLDEDARKFLLDEIASFTEADDPFVDEIEIEIDLPMNLESGIRDTHPIKVISQSIPESAKSIKWIISRVFNAHYPVSSDQAFVSIKVEIETNEGGGIFNKTMFSEALFAFYKRELGSMALVVAKDLHLNQPGFTRPPTESHAGNTYIPYHATKESAGEGVVFKSPVFINGDIHLPPTASPDDPYSNVTFASTVYLGGKGLYRDGALYAPPSSGNGRLPTYAELGFMGGFLNGIILEEVDDPGLRQLVATIDPGTSDSFTDVEACIERRKAKYNLAATKKSSLVVQQVPAPTAPPGSKTYKFNIGLTAANQFLPQTKIPDPATGDLPAPIVNGAWARPPESTNNGDLSPIAQLELVSGSSNFTAEVTPTTDITASQDVADIFSARTAAAEAARNAGVPSGLRSESSLIVARDAAIAALGSNTSASKASGLESRINEYTTNTVIVTAKEAVADCRFAGEMNSTDNAGNNITGVMKNDLENECDQYNGIVAHELTIDRHDARLALIRAYDEAVANENTYLANREANSPEIKFDFEPVTLRDPESGDNLEQPNLLSMTLTTTGDQNLPDSFTVNLRGYDLGNDLTGVDQRPEVHPDTGEVLREAGRNLQAEITLARNTATGEFEVLNFTLTPGDWKLGKASPGVSIQGGFNNPLDDTADNYAVKDEKCRQAGGADGGSFGFPDSDKSYTATTRKSWNFANPVPANISSKIWSPNLTSFKLQDVDDFTGGTEGENRYDKFQFRSIVSHCFIPDDTEFLAGFFTCDTLEIQPRTTPLVVIGSLIVGHMTIAQSAIEEGIRFYSIYHPEAVSLLRSKNILYPGTPGTQAATYDPGVDCKFPKQPIWHPRPAFKDLAKTFQCSPLALRALADNWTWTQVNPEQGYAVDNATNVVDTEPTSIPLPQRHLMKEISRHSNL